ncbi:transposase [Rhodococcus opacus]|uniref:transposase n=1 Tax=Rhodococcus opacus TaxID=37919 RepID=UPI00389A1824
MQGHIDALTPTSRDPRRRILAGTNHPHLRKESTATHTAHGARDRLHTRRRSGKPEQYRLLTTILDPSDAPAEELALAYAQRWEIENTFDELKTHQRGPRAVLRSKSPPLVRQEIWGHPCCHYAIRTLMLDAATAGRHDPDRRSFVTALRITRRSLSHSSFPPHNHTAVVRLWDQGIATLLRRVNPARRLRANPRVVKRKVLKWAAKRAHHQHHPQPTQSPICTILVH